MSDLTDYIDAVVALANVTLPDYSVYDTYQRIEGFDYDDYPVFMVFDPAVESTLLLLRQKADAMTLTIIMARKADSAIKLRQESEEFVAAVNADQTIGGVVVMALVNARAMFEADDNRTTALLTIEASTI